MNIPDSQKFYPLLADAIQLQETAEKALQQAQRAHKAATTVRNIIEERIRAGKCHDGGEHQMAGGFCEFVGNCTKCGICGGGA